MGVDSRLSLFMCIKTHHKRKKSELDMLHCADAHIHSNGNKSVGPMDMVCLG